MLVAGSTLGPYKILSPLGAGGMGEVYRARDTRLGRDVALKVLSPRLAATPEARARFEREARIISQINHPHVCALYDIGRQEGMDYLVMEFLEGETLVRRLEKGPLPVGEVLAIGAQVADALDKAHRAGVVHRDLKPGNIMLTAGGAKLLDFGLARPVGLVLAADALAESPTMSRPLTAEGTIVGTFQYMAPEQLEGKDADSRTDIWALGCVLYEMATGRRAFEGDSQASLIAAIMDREPPAVTELRPMSPPALEHLVKRCLAKDPAERWQRARDVAHEFKWIAEVGSKAGVPAPVASRRRSRESLAWGLALVASAVAIAAAAVFLFRPWTRRIPASALTRFAVTAPPGATVTSDASSAAISPDGLKLCFTVMDPSGISKLCVRPLETLSAQLLPGTDNAFLPFWSPDSRHIAFFANGKLQKVPAAGGPPEVICDAPSGRGGSWSKDGVIVFAPQALGPLMKVPSEGGNAVQAAKPDPSRQETGLRFPCFLPDGRRFLYVSLPRRQGMIDVFIGSLDSEEPRHLMKTYGAPVYAEPDHLLFRLHDHLMAQRFEMSSLRPVGEAMPLGDSPPSSSFEGAPLLSASATGVLAHFATSLPTTELVWMDRAGHPSGKVSLSEGSYTAPCLSPDGRKVTVIKPNSPTIFDLWMVDLERAVATRLTFEGVAAAGGGFGSSTVWSPDSTRVAFQSKRAGFYDVCQILASGAGRPEPLIQSDVVFKAPVAWSPDGRYLVFAENDKTTGWDLWLLPLEGDRKPAPYLRTPYNEMSAAISPDGRWLAYNSDETGTSEIYVTSFPAPGEKHRISTSGGGYAQWSGDGRELLIYTADQLVTSSGSVFSVDVKTGLSFKAGTPRLLFAPRRDILGITATRDFSRFLTAVPVEGSSPPSITVTMNWEAALKR